ncbi:BMP family ABC transporter substrate-binding protein [Phytomonospora sp. NPDC050363]|uniref:BMP family lipoprotein n=1 Tax=Phytomonospora sp. NPDC050363 TaxID=3155642 RepID=UPI0033C914EF
MKLIAALASGGLVLAVAACGKAPEDDGAGSTGTEFKGCMVTDLGGVDDKSFNSSAWQGMQDAATRDASIKVDYTQSNSEADYEPNLQAAVDGECDLIVAVGGLMFDATKKLAEANPEQQFAIVDAKVDLPNVFSMEFNTAQNSFMAGYLAAATTKTDKVATYGGLNIPPVTIFMDGFAEGVAHFNKVKDKKVEVLGWDPAKQEGSFAESFIDQQKGKSLTDTFVSQGADIIFPVAGGTGVGTANVAKENPELSVIWVDVDGCKSLADSCSVFLSTAEKNIPAAVTDALIAAKGGAKTGHYVGTLQNQGVSLAAFQEKASMVSAELQAELDTLKQDIIDGKVTIASKVQPAAA